MKIQVQIQVLNIKGLSKPKEGSTAGLEPQQPLL